MDHDVHFENVDLNASFVVKKDNVVHVVQDTRDDVVHELGYKEDIGTSRVNFGMLLPSGCISK